MCASRQLSCRDNMSHCWESALSHNQGNYIANIYAFWEHFMKNLEHFIVFFNSSPNNRW